jgi:hypothetical protein
VATPELILAHPNRETPAAQATRSAVVFLLLVGAALMAVVAAGGWGALGGQKPVLVAYVVAYLVLAVLAGRWQRGVLPVAATLAVILGILAAVAAPAWFTRQGTGFADPGLANGLLGLITALLVPAQVLLIFFCARGFAQDWHVEVERRPR